MTKRLCIDEVRRRFSDRGYELVGESYTNNSTPMKFKCNKHPNLDTEITLNRLMSGQGCRYCGYEKMGENRRLTQEEVSQKFTSRGYTLLDQYVKSSIKLNYICGKHPDTVASITYSDLHNGYGCYKCGREKTMQAISGSNSHFWKGGVTELGRYLREILTPWKQLHLSSFGYRCAITGVKSKELEVHHVKAFHVVRDETLIELGLTIKDTISEYSEEELKSIANLFLEKHEEIQGIPILKLLHIELHKSFGDTASLEDFLTFRDNHQTNYLGGEPIIGKAI